MKLFLLKITAFILTILVLLSSSFVTINKHYCSNILVDTSIFGNAHMCKMDMVSCKDESNTNTLMKSNCCYNTIKLKSGNYFVTDSDSIIDSSQNDFIPSYFFVDHSNPFVEPILRNTYFTDYSPPLITNDILVLVQRFLI